MSGKRGHEGDWAMGMAERGLKNRSLPVDDIVQETLYYVLDVPPVAATMNNTSTETNDRIPTHIPSDYVEIAILSIIFVFGSSLNTYVLNKLWRQHTTAKRHNRQDVKTTVLVFKLHLTVANLLVLVFYCPTKAAWLINYSWPLGNAPCKALHFVWLFCFCLSSNIIAAIAVDRSLHVWRLCQMNEGSGRGSSAIGGQKSFIIGKWLLLICWVSAAVCAAPQLRVFEKIVVSENWAQCTTVWRIDLFCTKLGRPYAPNVPVSENAYRVFHMLTVFWLPFFVIVASYAYIVLKLLAYSCRPYSAVPEMTNSRITGPTTNSTRSSADVGRRPTLTAEPTNNYELLPLTTTPTAAFTNHLVIADGGVAAAASAAASRRRSTLSRVPAWRLQMRTKMFRTAATIVLCYCICWGPYSAITVVAFVDDRAALALDDTVNWLKCFTMINAVLNPFLYGFQNPH